MGEFILTQHKHVTSLLSVGSIRTYKKAVPQFYNTSVCINRNLLFCGVEIGSAAIKKIQYLLLGD